MTLNQHYAAQRSLRKMQADNARLVIATRLFRSSTKDQWSENCLGEMTYLKYRALKRKQWKEEKALIEAGLASFKAILA